MKQRTLPEPTLTWPNAWLGAKGMRWRWRYAEGWAYAAWWLLALDSRVVRGKKGQRLAPPFFGIEDP